MFKMVDGNGEIPPKVDVFLDACNEMLEAYGVEISMIAIATALFTISECVVIRCKEHNHEVDFVEHFQNFLDHANEQRLLAMKMSESTQVDGTDAVN